MSKFEELCYIIVFEAMSIGGIFLGLFLVKLKVPESAFWMRFISDLSEFGFVLIIICGIYSLYIPFKAFELLFGKSK